MKKIFLVLLLIIFLSNVEVIKASNNVSLTQEYIDNVFFTRRGGGKPYVSAQYKTFSMDSNVVYCIEPGIDIITNSYIAYDSIDKSGLDSNISSLIELIGYYGYDYPNHQTLKYRMATQALIWEKTGGQIIEFWTKQYGNGENINITKEKNEIMKLVNSHHNTPSFNNNKYNIILGESIDIIDNNNILNDFELVENAGIEVNKKNNSLNINTKKVGTFKLELRKKRYDLEKTSIYIGSNPKSQKMAFFRYGKDVIANITVNVVGGKVKLNKYDYETNSNKPIVSNASLANATYGIYDKSNNLITTITTNNDGYAESENIIPIGNYYLQEISPSRGYILDTEKYFFEINKENLIVDLKVYEQIISRDVLIKKNIKNKNNDKIEPESDIKFNIYDINNNLIKEVTTDKDGEIRFNLFYGDYIIKQVNSSAGYQKIDDLKVQINEDSLDVIELSLIDLPIKVAIKVNKKDYDTKKNILEEGITFKIKNKDTNSYVCYNDLNNKLICEYKTNSRGEFTTSNNLIYGNYQIEEIKGPNGYILNKEPHSFKIDDNTKIINNENGNYISIVLYNKSIKGSIKITKSGEIIKIDNNNYYYGAMKLQDVKFSLYAKEDIVLKDGTILYKKDAFIKNMTSDESGMTIFNNLNLGKYYIRETGTIDGYEIDEKEYIFDINEKENNLSIELNNTLIKGHMKIVKKEVNTTKIIPDTLFAIYNEKNECLRMAKTDKLGEIVINNLPLGKYYIKEIQSAKGYKLNDELYEVEISKKDAIEEIVVFNHKDIINVPNTGIEDNNFIKLVVIIFIILGISCVYIGIKYLKKL